MKTRAPASTAARVYRLTPGSGKNVALGTQPGVWAAKSSVQALRSAAMSGWWAYARAVKARTPSAARWATRSSSDHL